MAARVNQLQPISLQAQRTVNVPMAKGTVVTTEGKCVPSKRSISGWPNYQYLDVSLSQPSDIDFITFTNYYTCSVTVKWQSISNRDSENWNTCIENHILMKNCHCESGSEDNVVLGHSELKGSLKEVASLRIVMKQPSFMWKEYNILNLKCYCLQK